MLINLKIRTFSSYPKLIFSNHSTTNYLSYIKGSKMSIFEGINFPEELGLDTRIERMMFRMTLPLSNILSDVEKGLNSIRQLDLETDTFLQTTRIDPPPITSTTECPVCGTIDLASSHRLPCSHVICGTCLADWLAIAGSCPFCRYKLTNRIFIDDDFDPRNEAYARSILTEIFLQGRLYLQTNPADVTFRGFYKSGAIGEATGKVGPKMEFLDLLFQQFSTTFEDSSMQSDLGQDFKTRFWEENSAALAAGWTEQVWRAMRCGIESPYRDSPLSPTDSYSGNESGREQSSYAASDAGGDKGDENDSRLD